MTSLIIAKQILAAAFFVPVERIADDDAISDVKPLDSLAFEALILELEDQTGKEIDPVSLLELKTVRDLARLIDNLT